MLDDRFTEGDPFAGVGARRLERRACATHRLRRDANAAGGQVSERNAQAPAGLAKDITEFMVSLGLTDSQAPKLKVGYHAACSLQHGQKVTAAPKTLLKAAGFEVVEPHDAHLCCGSAGTYNLLQPKISAELKARKVATLEKTGPDVIAAGNIGCMMQIGSGTGIPVVHTAELLDWATGGPKPAALADAD